MAFQAVIGPNTLKSFTKSLACLSRYSDDVAIQASQKDLVLTATNSAKSAFCRVTLTSEYFDKYKLKPPTPPGLTFQTPPDVEESETVTGQLIVKSLLSILRHKTVEKSVDRCDLSIVESGMDSDQTANAEEDTLESKLIVRLHCKHGVVKTHQLLLLTPLSILAPPITSLPKESQVTVGPRALKDILEHFPHSKGTKNYSQLVWLFSANEVKVKTMQLGGNNKGKSQISTEITMSADDFDSYNIYEPPVSLAFHLREFNATVALADFLSVALKLRFTEARAPIFIEFDTDSSDLEFLCVISTTQSIYDSPLISTGTGSTNLRKRDREEVSKTENKDDSEEAPRVKKKSMPAAVRVTSSSTSQATTPRTESISQRGASSEQPLDHDGPSVSGAPEKLDGPEPLFMPGASQLSNADIDVLRASGLGIGHMDYEEFEAMMEAEGEEVGMSTAVQNHPGDQEHEGNLEWEGGDTGMDYDQYMGPSQVPVERIGEREFRPLFDD